MKSPISLVLVAVLFILDGVSLIGDGVELMLKIQTTTVAGATASDVRTASLLLLGVYFCIGVLIVGAGFGLIRLRRGWWKFSIIVVCIHLFCHRGLLEAGVFDFLVVCPIGNINVTESGNNYPPGLTSLLATAYLLLICWMLWALLRHKTRELLSQHQAAII